MSEEQKKQNPLATLRLKRGWELTISRAALEHLGNPGYVRFLWSAEMQVLVIGAATADTPQSLRSGSANYKRGGAVSFWNHNFIEAILKLTQWKRDYIYTVHGEYLPKLDMVAFEIQNAVQEEVPSNE